MLLQETNQHRVTIKSQSPSYNSASQSDLFFLHRSNLRKKTKPKQKQNANHFLFISKWDLKCMLYFIHLLLRLVWGEVR